MDTLASEKLESADDNVAPPGEFSKLGNPGEVGALTKYNCSDGAVSDYLSTGASHNVLRQAAGSL